MTRSYCPTPETCTAPRRGVCRCQIDDDASARLSRAMTAQWADPVMRYRMMRAIKTGHADPEYRARRSQLAKDRWADPEYRDLQSRLSKARWADPDYRARVSAASKQARAKKHPPVPIPAHLKSYARKLRRCGIRGDDFRKALEAHP